MKLIGAIAEIGETARKDTSRPLVPKPIRDLSDPTLRFSDLLGQLTPQTQGQIPERIAAASEAADFLARERVALNPDGRRRFLAANAFLRRRAEGDYAPDARPARFPEWRPAGAAAQQKGGSAQLSAMALYKAWSKANEARTSASTRNRRISVFRDLERFAGREVVGVLRQQSMSWSLQRGLGIELPPM